MNHINFIEIETKNYLNSVESRVHLESLQLMTIEKAQEAIALYTNFIELKKRDIEKLNS